MEIKFSQSSSTSLTETGGKEIDQNARCSFPAQAAKRNVPLPDGSLLIIAGATQRDFLHGAKKTTSKAFEESGRVNVKVCVIKK